MNAHQVFEQALADSDALSAAMDRYGAACERAAHMAAALAVELETQARLVEAARVHQMAALEEEIAALNALMAHSAMLVDQAAITPSPPVVPLPGDH